MRHILNLSIAALFCAGSALAQSCPSPVLSPQGYVILVTLEAASAVNPATTVEIWGNNPQGMTRLSGPINITHQQGSFYTRSDENDPDITGQIYALSGKINPTTQQVEVSPRYVVNRRRLYSRPDKIAIARFGSSNADENYLLRFEVPYDSNGAPQEPINISCTYSTTILDFNEAFLSSVVGIPKIALALDANAYLYHQSLYTPDYLALVNNLQSQAHLTQDGLDAAKSDIQSLQSTDTTQGSVLASLRSGLETTNQRIDTSSTTIEALQSEISTLRGSTDSVASSLDVVSNENSNASKNIAELTKQLQATSRALLAATKRLTRAEKRIRKLERSLTPYTGATPASVSYDGPGAPIGGARLR